jgi:hypothetical protein
MNEATRRWLYCVLITSSVVLTPIVGIWGPFASGNGTAPAGREYFLPAGFVFGTVWTINYLGLAAYGIKHDNTCRPTPCCSRLAPLRERLNTTVRHLRGCRYGSHVRRRQVHAPSHRIRTAG